jgi:membrane-associated phospholipid phosphatase
MENRVNPEEAPKPRAYTRREMLRLTAAAPLALAVAGEAAAQVATIAVRAPQDRERTAGAWQPWLVPSVRSVRPGRPPANGSDRTRAELRELLELQNQRGDAIRVRVAFWDLQGGIPRWSRILLDTIKANGTNPVRAARALALLHTAIADAVICAWDAKWTYNRAHPSRLSRPLTTLSAVDDLLGTYTSEHAAIAGAASVVLNYLFPGQTAVVRGERKTFDAIANEAALSRLYAGANYRTDVEVGLRMGQSIGWSAVARGENDGSKATWDVTRQPGRLGAHATGNGADAPYWSPTAPANVFPPLEPMAPYWDPWLLESGSQFRAPVPPGLQGGFPNAAFLAEVAEVKNVVANLTPEQRQIALFWADGAGTVTPPGHWIEVAIDQIVYNGVSTPRAARALALLSAGLADCAISCWDNKYAYWLMRPITAIRAMEGYPFHDPNWLSPVGTPPFPAYTSGHSTFSGCSAAVLNYLFPGGTVKDAFGHSVSYAEAAEQAAVSRLYGGIHYRSDNDLGLIAGRGVASLVIRRAQSDGADKPSAPAAAPPKRGWG